MAIAETAPVAIAFTREELTILNSALSRHLSYVGTTTDEQQHEAVSALLLRVQDHWIAKPQPLRVLVVVEDMHVTSIVSDIPVQAICVDYDVEGIALRDASYSIAKRGAPATEEALRSIDAALVDPSYIDEVMSAALCMDIAVEIEDKVERWIACTFPDTVADHCWHFSATFAFEGDFESVSGLIPATSSSRAHAMVAEMLAAICGEVSKLDVTLRPPVSALVCSEAL